MIGDSTDSLLISLRRRATDAYAVAEAGRGHGNKSIVVAISQVRPVRAVQSCRSSCPGVEDEGPLFPVFPRWLRLRAGVQDMLYIVLIAAGRAVTLVRPKKHSIHPSGIPFLLHLGLIIAEVL